MALSAIVYLPALIICYVSAVHCEKDAFTEELWVQPLPTGHLYSYFQFTTKWDFDPEIHGPRHYRLFPRPLGEIVTKHSVRELHVSLTQGSWRTRKWGYPVRQAGPGAEISVWFQPHLKPNEVDAEWSSLVNSLSGLLCASLNFVTASNTISPQWSFAAEGLHLPGTNTSHSRYAHLPQEIVCTENLTPWKKLLPCESHSGLGELLNAKNMYNSNYHSLALDLRPICLDAKCQRTCLELKLSLSLVTEPTVSNGNTHDGIRSDWSMKSVYGSLLFSSCPKASVSRIYIDTTSNETGSTQWSISPVPTESISSRRGASTTRVSVYDLKQVSSWPLHVRSTYKRKLSYGTVPGPLVHATRFLGGHGQAKGTLISRIHNNYHSSDLQIVHLELVPWYCRMFIHTLTITNDKNKAVRIDKQYFKPALDRSRPNHLELHLNLPANSVTQIEWQFYKGFLKWTEYPPDAHRGFDLGPAVISTVLPVARNWTALPRHVSTFHESWNVTQAGYLVRIHTDNLVVVMATPDFSMPYNVICLACTVVALAFGPLFNLTTKRLVLKDTASAGGLLAKLKGLASKFSGKVKDD